MQSNNGAALTLGNRRKPGSVLLHFARFKTSIRRPDSSSHDFRSATALPHAASLKTRACGSPGPRFNSEIPNDRLGRDGIIQLMPEEPVGSMSDQLALFRKARAEEAVGRLALDRSGPRGAHYLRLVLHSAPSVIAAAEALAPLLSPDEILALVVSEDAELSTLGQDLAFYLGSEYLEAMATSEDPALARAAGQAIFRALLEAPEPGQ